jgi:CheY-like chemotaxis protein
MKQHYILLVDDDPDDAEIFTTAVKAVDDRIKISAENNALDALKKLKDARKLPQIIFLDYYMPYLDGSEFIELLRSIKGMKKIPVVFYSGHSSEALEELTQKHKTAGFVQKQNTFAELIQSLKGILSSGLPAL